MLIKQQGSIQIDIVTVFSLLVIVAACVVIHRLYTIQIISGHEYREQVVRQHQQVVTKQDSIRGDVYFTYHDSNRLLAATDHEYHQLVINNRHVQDPLELRRVLRTYVDHDHERLETILQKTNDPYEILKSRLTDEEFMSLQKHRVRGIELHSKKERYYPLGDLGSMVLGFVSFQGDVLGGTYGLEKYYDTILSRDGAVQETSLLFSLFGSRTSDKEEEDETAIEKYIAREGSLVVTIEPVIQESLQREVRAVDQTWKSEFTAGVVMNARDGTIVAMTDSREFDNNTERRNYRNPLIEERYEFGSVMKPLTVAIGLDTGAIDNDFSYFDHGNMTLNRLTISNFDRRGRGASTDLQAILTQSLNTGAAEIALDIGADRFIDYVEKLGLGRETGIDLPYEIYGNIENIDTGRAIELATASYGQGVAVTAMEMLRAWGALANDGVIKTPYLVDVIEYGDLIPARNIPAGRNNAVFDTTTASDVTRMLVNIVDDSQTFSPYALPNHSVAIKTGTAQIARPTGGYYSDQFLHAMAGYFPAEAEPNQDKYVMFIFTYKPQGVRYSSTTMKEPFFNMVETMINYYELPPDRNLSSLENFE